MDATIFEHLRPRLRESIPDLATSEKSLRLLLRLRSVADPGTAAEATPLTKWQSFQISPENTKQKKCTRWGYE